MINPISVIIGAVGGFFGRREDRKSMEKQIDGKIAMQKQGGETQVIFNEQEIDAIAKRNEDGTLKDEYLTLVMTSPLLTTFFGVFVAVLLNKPEIMEAVTASNKALLELVPNYQELLAVTITAGLGLRAYKRR